MAVYYRTQAFVLTKDNLREADQIFNIYAKDFGRLKILGKSIRKIRSKLKSGIQPFCLSEVEFVQGKFHKTLTDAVIIRRFENIKQYLEKLKIAYQIAEISSSLIKGQEKDKKVWNLLNEVFEKLDSCSGYCSLVYYYFLWNLLSILGYGVDFYNCSFCRKKLSPQKLYFCLEKTGIFCLDCSGRASENKEEVSPEVIKILRLFLKRDWAIISRLKMTEFYKESLELISDSYLSCLEQKDDYGKKPPIII